MWVGQTLPTGEWCSKEMKAVRVGNYKVLEPSLRWGDSPDKERVYQATGASAATACPFRNMDMSPV